MTREIALPVEDGTYAGVDFGGDGPDILLLHQLTSNAEIWTPLGEALASIGHPVAIDLLGHGHTRIPEDDVRRIAGDLSTVVAGLGLRRPLVITQFEEILALSPDRLAGLEPCGVLVLNLSTLELGEDAAAEWAETDGPASLATWDERFGLLASGTPEEREAHIASTMGAADTDWVLDGVQADDLRGYIERKVMDTADGWECLPRRPFLEAALGLIEDGPHGIEVLDDVTGVAWVALPSDALLDSQVQALTEHSSGPDRQIRVVEGGPMVRSMNTDAVVALAAEMLQGSCRAQV